MWELITKLVDANALGGWVRAAVASLFAAMLVKSSTLSAIFSPEIQTAIGVAVSGVVVGIWSHVSKVATPSK